jgi:predicted  nucleic acid-binding Zn-ribbon protein|tara:strand:+ start:2161 stop:2370 length:210 start_codon:yes stop_codon:yes gene_type:complete
MGRKKKDLRSKELSLHLRIQTKRDIISRLMEQYSELKEKISDEKAHLREMLEEHKEIRETLKEQEGYRW